MLSRRLAALAACFVLGAATGATLATLRLGQRLHQAMNERDALHQQAADLQARLQRLEESQKRRSRRPVTGLEVRIQGLDPGDDLKLKEQVRLLLDEFVGREVTEVDPALVARVVDGRLLDLGGRTVQLKLQQLWVTDRLTIWLAVTAPAR